jgi:hypothetical protein
MKSQNYYFIPGVFLAFCVFINTKTIAQKSEKESQKPEKLNYELLKHEKLGRGLIAIPLEKGQRVYNGEARYDETKRKVYIGWRLLANDPEDIAFNLYRRVDNEPETKLNETPVTNSTNFVDVNLPEGQIFSYTVRPIFQGKEGAASKRYSITRSNETKGSYISIALNGNYNFSKVGIADLDGDGEYDFVTKRPDGNVDPWYLYWQPSKGTFMFEAYKNDGMPLWTYDMGWAIEQGIWYSPFVVYDLNGDGKAEFAVKSGEKDPRDAEGKVVSGKEYLTILDGMTGKPIAQTDWISRDPFFAVNTQHAYNYASRNQIGVAYLDGKNPHLIVERGTYNLMIVQAYRLIDNKLKLVWEWDNRNAPKKYWGQGGHTFSSADIDQDGCDEVILGSCALDHDGKELWSTGLGHNDQAYIGDLNPDHAGLEIYYGIESTQTKGNGMCMVDAKTGIIIWGIDFPTHHIHGSGLCSDIDRVHPGRECYSGEISTAEGKRFDFAVMHNSQGEIIDREIIGGTSPRCLYWDTDNQRELLVDGRIFDYQGETTHAKIEGNVIAIADIFGDWREEIITSLPGELRIYTSTMFSDSRNTCLMQDPIYRNCVAHGAMGYTEVPSTTYDLPFKK